ncbi:hypothetical protein NT6N_19860 [Oceaniferula spumae]|uniref:Lipid/polyisoprenoid-binding YceI-like domain-containing protein n=1 Tax=Oceaniferula spumae TaxID=2979115 RepID=A0AAT9FM00_9BACT
MKIPLTLPNTIFILLLSGILSSCGFWKNDDHVARLSSPVPELPPKPIAPAIPSPSKKPETQTWIFNIDEKRTTGVIDLSMDPKGAMLGSRLARDTAPLKGKITVLVTDNTKTGERRISIKDIRITNTGAYHMDYAWGALVGNITVDIPAGVINIKPNTITQSSRLEKAGPFAIPQCYFTVLGHSHVSGRGLVLSKAVPRRKVDLTMKKTQQVTLRGDIKISKGTATLHIPRAVLRDSFDFDGTKLGLLFTANITATATVK